MQAFITLNFLVSGYHQYNNNIEHTTKTHLSYIVVVVLLLYSICMQRAVCYTFVLSFFCLWVFVCGCIFFRFFHFFYTNWWLFTAFVHHMLTERTFQTRNHHSQHMHTTDSFNICFCSSFFFSFRFRFYILLSWRKKKKKIRLYIDHHFHFHTIWTERKTIGITIAKLTIPSSSLIASNTIIDTSNRSLRKTLKKIENLDSRECCTFKAV